MVVMITSTGGVSKRIFALADPVDTGLALWAGEYLNEQLAGLELGAPRCAAGSTIRRCPHASAPSSSCCVPRSPS